MSLNLIGPSNKKLLTKCDHTDIKRAVKVGNMMMKFVRSHPCLGLAANQLGIMERVCVAKIGWHGDLSIEMRVYINPEIIERQGNQLSVAEGCLSFPGIRGDIKRPQKIKVKYISVKKWQETEIEIEYSGMDAIIMEHEIDHLNGIRCIDKMTNIRRYRQRNPFIQSSMRHYQNIRMLI